MVLPGLSNYRRRSNNSRTSRTHILLSSPTDRCHTSNSSINRSFKVRGRSMDSSLLSHRTHNNSHRNSPYNHSRSRPPLNRP